MIGQKVIDIMAITVKANQTGLASFNPPRVTSIKDNFKQAYLTVKENIFTVGTLVLGRIYIYSSNTRLSNPHSLFYAQRRRRKTSGQIYRGIRPRSGKLFTSFDFHFSAQAI